jgi:hypothetical protein
MSLQLYKAHGDLGLIPARATRAPLGALSCPYSHRDVVRRPYEEPQLHRSFRSFGPNPRGTDNRCSARAADPSSSRDPWTTDYWNPPTTPSEHARQRILAVIVVFTLAAILTQAGW